VNTPLKQINLTDAVSNYRAKSVIEQISKIVARIAHFWVLADNLNIKTSRDNFEAITEWV
jgi:hypothetical protein